MLSGRGRLSILGQFGQRESERGPPSLLQEVSIVVFFLFVYLFSVTAVKREAGGGMNAASPPGREREGDSVCFILKLCHANGALALIISLLCLCFAAFLYSGCRI